MSAVCNLPCNQTSKHQRCTMCVSACTWVGTIPFSARQARPSLSPRSVRPGRVGPSTRRRAESFSCGCPSNTSCPCFCGNGGTRGCPCLVYHGRGRRRPGRPGRPEQRKRRQNPWQRASPPPDQMHRHRWTCSLPPATRPAARWRGPTDPHPPPLAVGYALDGCLGGARVARTGVAARRGTAQALLGCGIAPNQL